MLEGPAHCLARLLISLTLAPCVPRSVVAPQTMALTVAEKTPGGLHRAICVECGNDTFYTYGKELPSGVMTIAQIICAICNDTTECVLATPRDLVQA